MQVTCKGEASKIGSRRKPQESTQCKEQNQNRVPTACMGVVGMYRDQRNATGGDQNGFDTQNKGAAYCKCWTQLSAASNVRCWNSWRLTQAEAKMQKTCNANLEIMDLMQCKNPWADRACWETKTQGPETRSEIKAILKWAEGVGHSEWQRPMLDAEIWSIQQLSYAFEKKCMHVGYMNVM